MTKNQARLIISAAHGFFFITFIWLVLIVLDIGTYIFLSVDRGLLLIDYRFWLGYLIFSLAFSILYLIQHTDFPDD